MKLPKDWKLETLSKYGSSYSGLSGKTKEDFGFGKPYISYLKVFTKTVILDGDFDLVNITEKENQSLVENGDLLFTISSETPKEVGMCAVYAGNEKYLYLNSFCFGFRSYDKNKISAHFLAILLRSEIGRNLVYKLAQGATRYNLSKTSLLNEELPLPPLGEQKKIAEILSTWDRAIETTEKLVAAKQKLKKSLMQRLLTGAQRFPEFRGQEWTKHKIADLFEEVARYVNWSDEDLYKLVSIRRRFKGLFPRGDFFGHQIGVKKLKSIHSEDFLISKRQVSHGAWGVVTPEFHDTKVSDEYDCIVVKDKNKINIDFWGWLCKTPQMQRYSYLSSNGVHIEKLIFDFNDFKKRSVFVPSSIEEQKKIAAVLNECDAEINVLQNKLDALRRQKSGLMQKLLIGQVRVKTDEDQEQ